MHRTRTVLVLAFYIVSICIHIHMYIHIHIARRVAVSWVKFTEKLQLLEDAVGDMQDGWPVVSKL